MNNADVSVFLKMVLSEELVFRFSLSRNYMKLLYVYIYMYQLVIYQYTTSEITCIPIPPLKKKHAPTQNSHMPWQPRQQELLKRENVVWAKPLTKVGAKARSESSGDF